MKAKKKRDSWPGIDGLAAYALGGLMVTRESLHTCEELVGQVSQMCEGIPDKPGHYWTYLKTFVGHPPDLRDTFSQVASGLALIHRHPARYADFALRWVGMGATIIGGMLSGGS